MNSVTAERVKWINALRENVAELTGLTYNWSASGTWDETSGEPGQDKERQKARDETVLKLDRLQMLIKLQLNPIEDQAIISKLDELRGHTHKFRIDQLKADLSALISMVQALLKDEWEKVKDEARSSLIPRWLRCKPVCSRRHSR
ncbi:MAG: hypothetical protein AB7J30_16235 [Hyphomicrobium sp.]|uniref:hypothetical protein n=1 Tax=Hyphomicrobium sp. TaxID=82 RepID=UPI003D12386D